MRRTSRSSHLEGFSRLCRTHGLSMTEQRRQVYAALCDVTSHPTADEVYELVRPRLPSISRTTVYRVLDVLADTGIIQRVPHPRSSSRFDGNPKRHHHLVCRVCGKVLDVHDRKLGKLDLHPRASQGFEVEDFSIVFTGTCGDCPSEG